MELPQLEALTEAAKRGSFRRAAEALFLSQPSLTERIRRLETELGKPLFLRTSRGVVLTEAGKALLPFAEGALVSVREGREAALAARPMGREALRVGASVVAMYYLSETFQEFRDWHSTGLIVRSARTEDIVQMVLREEVDVGAGWPVSHPKVQTVLICHEEVLLVTPRSHQLAKRAHVHLGDLAGETLIQYSQEPHPLLSIVDRAAGPLPNAQIIVDDIEVAKHMIERGLGIAFMPPVVVRREVEQGLFSTVRVPDARKSPWGVAAILPKRQPWSPQVHAFLALLQERFRIGWGVGGGRVSDPQSFSPLPSQGRGPGGALSLPKGG